MKNYLYLSSKDMSRFIPFLLFFLHWPQTEFEILICLWKNRSHLKPATFVMSPGNCLPMNTGNLGLQ